MYVCCLAANLFCVYFHCSIVDSTNSQSSNSEDESDNHWLLVTCVFISIAFNILFMVIIGLTFRKNRALTRSNRQLVTRGGFHYSRINDRMNSDEANDEDNSNTSNTSSSPSPVNGDDDNEDDPMIEL